VFIDDILIYYESEEKNEEHLRMMLQVLREQKLYANLSKGIFYQKNIHYLRHIISTEGIVVDPKNIETIRGRSAPNHVKDVISFIGLVDYYQRFIKGFSKIAIQITSL
jgi:hypothetical protein